MRTLYTLLLIAVSCCAQGLRGTVKLIPKSLDMACTGGCQMYADGPYAINSADRKLSYQWKVDRTSAIVGIDLALSVTGTQAADTRWRLRVETDSSDAPSGTVLGAATDEFAVTANGWIGRKEFASDTGALTSGASVWISLYYSSGTEPTGTVYIGERHDGQGSGSGLGTAPSRLRLWNGSDWSTTAFRDQSLIVYFADGSVAGFPFENETGSARGNFYGTTRHGIKWKIGGTLNYSVSGFVLYVGKRGSPADLEVSLYDGDTLRETATIPAASVANQTVYTLPFSTAHAMSSGNHGYLILHQAGDGGSNLNDYAIRVQRIATAYQDGSGLAMVSGMLWRTVRGTSATPSELTEYVDEAPVGMAPLIADPYGITTPAGGGGSYTWIQ